MSSAADFKAKGNKHLQAGEYDEAIKAYTDAINMDPKDHVFFSNRSAAYLSKGDADSALSDSQRCIQLKPDWPKGYVRKGAALHSKRMYDEAMDAYNDGLKIAPEDASLKSGLADVEKANNSHAADRAADAMNGFFAPDKLAMLAGHPKFGPKLNDPAFQQKINLMKTNPNMMMQDPEMMELFQALISGAMPGMSGMGDGMNEPFAPSPTSVPAPKKKVPEPEPELPEDKKRSKEAKDRGNALYKERKFDEALTAYAEAIEIDPSNYMLLSNKAAVYIEKGETDTAISICESIFDKAKEAGESISFENKAKVLQRIAAAHVRSGDVPKGLEYYGKAQVENFEKAVERKIKNLELDEKKRKIKEYINPEEGLAAKERGNQAFRDGDFPTAIKEYEDATKRDPTNAPYHNNLAAAYTKMGVFNDAKRSVEKALEIDKSYVKAWAKKGDIEFFMKEYHKSMDSYKAGLQLEPDNSLCKQGLQKVIMKINEANMDGSVDKERQAHAMADPEIQMILQDPAIRQVLTDFQENPKYAQQAMNDPVVSAKIQKLISAGVLQVK